MRRYLLVVPFLFACAKKDNMAADSAAMAAAPAALTEAAIAGTWSGTATLQGTDSTIAHWTTTCANGTCRFTQTESPKDTIQQTYVIEGDSVVGSAGPYAEASMGGTMVTDHWVGRITGNQIMGTGMAKLADKPDSVVMRYTFTGTKAP